MLVLKKVAVTGGLSCGKSSVCRFFRKLGAYVVSADEVVHQLLSPETQLGQDVARLLGQDIIVDGRVDRAIIAKKVFNDPKLLNSLENLLHPAVRKEINHQYEQVRREGKHRLFVAEIPLYYEGNGAKDYDAVVAVVADPEKSKQRFKQAGFNSEEFEKRSSRQLSPDEKAKRADYVITNNGSLEDLEQSVKEVYDKLIH